MSTGTRLMIVGRNKLRSNLEELTRPGTDYHVMVVSGPKGSGKTFSNHLIQHVARKRGIGTVFTDIAGGLELSEACEHIANSMGLDVAEMRAKVLADQPTPDRIGRKFAMWLGRQTAQLKGYHWWLVFDGFDEADGPSPELRDHLVQWLARLSAPNDRGVRYITNVSLILLGATASPDRRLIQHTLKENLDFLRAEAIEPFLLAYAQSAGVSLTTDELSRRNRKVIDGIEEPFTPPRLQQVLQRLTDELVEIDLQRDQPSAVVPSSSALKAASVPEIAMAPDKLESFRQAAAVLVAFDPMKLRSAEDEEAGEVALALLPELVPSPFLAEQRQFPWSLGLANRKRVLARIKTADALRECLAANTERPNLPLQQVLDRAIGGQTFDLPELQLEELNALATACDWLAATDLGARLPSSTVVRQEADRQRDLHVLQELVGDTFTGRKNEIALIEAHIASTEPTILFLAATGGMGKSALIAHTLLRRKDQLAGLPVHWLRIDLDNSLLQPERPYTILREVADQLRRRHPDLLTILEDFKQLVDEMATQSESEEVEQATPLERRLAEVEAAFHEVISYALTQHSNPSHANAPRIILWVDTFEEAQFLGDQVSATLMSFLIRLAKQEPHLRIIVTGRTAWEGSNPSAGILGSTIRKKAIRNRTLPHLAQPVAVELLAKLLAQRSDAPRLSQRELRSTATALQGNPLTLRLGADLLCKEGKRVLDDLKTFGAEAQQRWIYTRILQHLHGSSEIDRLAFPGLIVRRLNPEVIMNVLAEPCQLGPIDLVEAQRLFDLLSQEISLLELDSTDGSLKHRQDVRRLMLDGIQLVKPEVAQAIDENAISYWNAKAGAIARAEEIYHRLRLQQPAAILNDHWDPASAPLLRSALIELPAESPARLWLAERLKAGLKDNEIRRLTQAEWEKQVAMEAQRALASGNPAAALDALKVRRRRLPGSPLYALQARAHLLLSHADRALKTLDRGIRSARHRQPETAVGLLLLKAFILERQHKYRSAKVVVSAAERLAERTSDVSLRLDAGVRHLRLLRQQRKPAPPELLERVKSLTAQLGPSALASKPTLLREAAAELGGESPQVLQLATDYFLEELLRARSSPEILQFLTSAGLAFGGSEADALQYSHSTELAKLARSRLAELLASGPPANPENWDRAVTAVRSLFQESVEGLLNRDFGAPVTAATASARPASDPFADDPAGRQRLEKEMAETPKSILERAAQLILRTDYDRLIAGGDPLATAREMVERALNLGRIEELTQFLRSSGTIPPS